LIEALDKRPKDQLESDVQELIRIMKTAHNPPGFLTVQIKNINEGNWPRNQPSSFQRLASPANPSPAPAASLSKPPSQEQGQKDVPSRASNESTLGESDNASSKEQPAKRKLVVKDSRPAFSVGDRVRIKDTTRAELVFEEGIGKIAAITKVKDDEEGLTGYMVEGDCASWLYRDDLERVEQEEPKTLREDGTGDDLSDVPKKDEEKDKKGDDEKDKKRDDEKDRKRDDEKDKKRDDEKDRKSHGRLQCLCRVGEPSCPQQVVRVSESIGRAGSSQSVL